jgi:hypothetical protein
MAASGNAVCACTPGERKGPAPARRKKRRVKPAGASSHAKRSRVRG